MLFMKRRDAGDPVQLGTLIKKYGNEVDVIHYNAGVLHYDGAGNLAMDAIEYQSAKATASAININITEALITLSKIIPVMEQLHHRRSARLRFSHRQKCSQPWRQGCSESRSSPRRPRRISLSGRPCVLEVVCDARANFLH
jgi:hypothetical protein